MNRCAPRLMAALILLAASTPFLSLPAAAQSGEFKASVRPFPQSALRGELVVLSPPVISMDGKPDRLSVGSRIYDANNHLVLSAALVNQKLLVNYLRESAGQVHQVWILNSEEAREKRRGAADTLFNFSSGSAATPADDGKTPDQQLPADAR
jgi:hypothetical protein